MRVWTLFAAVSVMLAMTSPAMACRQEARTSSEIATQVSAEQADAWDKADLVFVARIEQRVVRPVPGFSDAPQVSLMPLTWLKGQAGPWQFDMAATGWTTCGLVPGFDVLGGQVGDEFIFFVKGDTPMQEAVIDTVSVDALVEPRVLAALKAQE